jgi:predicted transcriptional regulator YheO
MELLVAFITGVMGPVLIILVKYYLDQKKKNKPDIVMDTLRVSELVNSKIEHIKDEFDADRVWVSQFHNGGNFYPTGKSIAKFSIMYETVGQNAVSVQTTFKNIPVNLFSKSINELLNNDTIEITNVHDQNVDTYGLRSIADQSGCRSTYLFAIKTIEDRFIGILCVDYTSDYRNLDLEEINHLQVQATSIGGVLMSYLNQ